MQYAISLKKVLCVENSSYYYYIYDYKKYPLLSAARGEVQ